jgi:hypothetical protein
LAQLAPLVPKLDDDNDPDMRASLALSIAEEERPAAAAAVLRRR